jgi:hypothetical protein
MLLPYGHSSSSPSPAAADVAPGTVGSTMTYEQVRRVWSDIQGQLTEVLQQAISIAPSSTYFSINLSDLPPVYQTLGVPSDAPVVTAVREAENEASRLHADATAAHAASCQCAASLQNSRDAFGAASAELQAFSLARGMTIPAVMRDLDLVIGRMKAIAAAVGTAEQAAAVSLREADSLRCAAAAAAARVPGLHHEAEQHYTRQYNEAQANSKRRYEAMEAMQVQLQNDRRWVALCAVHVTASRTAVDSLC